MNKSQRKCSDNKEDEFRKRLANQLYKHLEQIEDTSLRDIDKNLVELRKQFNKQNQQSKVNQSKQAPSPKEKILTHIHQIVICWQNQSRLMAQCQYLGKLNKKRIK